MYSNKSHYSKTNEMYIFNFKKYIEYFIAKILLFFTLYKK